MPFGGTCQPLSLPAVDSIDAELTPGGVGDVVAQFQSLIAGRGHCCCCCCCYYLKWPRDHHLDLRHRRVVGRVVDRLILRDDPIVADRPPAVGLRPSVGSLPTDICPFSEESWSCASVGTCNRDVPSCEQP